MANKTLGRDWFLISWETIDDANRNEADTDPTNVFSCRESTSRYLGIPEESKFKGNVIIKVEGVVRTFTLADGTVLDKSATNKDGKTADYERELTKRVGKRRVIIRTRKPIAVAAGAKKKYHTISFAFPKRTPVVAIQDALSELIPDSKKKEGATDIFPSFKLEGGGSYGILSKAAGEASKRANTNKSASQNKLKAEGADIVDEPAGT
jgi:hypothetical protein